MAEPFDTAEMVSTSKDSSLAVQRAEPQKCCQNLSPASWKQKGVACYLGIAPVVRETRQKDAVELANFLLAAQV